MNHTPGKWVVFHEFNVKEESTGRSIANCGGYQDYLNQESAYEKNVANAWLISASPELLAACKEFIKACENGLDLERIATALRMARMAVDTVNGWIEIDDNF